MDYVTKKIYGNKTEIPEEIINKFKIDDDSKIVWTATRNKEIILHIVPRTGIEE